MVYLRHARGRLWPSVRIPVRWGCWVSRNETLLTLPLVPFNQSSCSSALRSGQEKRGRGGWMERWEENMTMNSSQSATPSPLNLSSPFMSVIFHYLWSKETFVGVLLHGASLDSGNMVLDTSTVCLPTLFLFPTSLPRLFSILIGVAEPQFHSRKL